MRKKTLILSGIALAVSFLLSLGTLFSQNGGPPPVPTGSWALDEGETEVILAGASRNGTMTVRNDGPGVVRLIVRTPDGETRSEVIIDPGEEKGAGVYQGDSVLVRDVKDPDDHGSEGTWSFGT